ncbi:MAG TPA: alpha/beta hydrolase [Glaciihabitans sp.]|jgi:pimeloyl-ACP methyl ester carboxylesterase|nr:alpha/beta hydrolase [Glaciihabitans sp.]
MSNTSPYAALLSAIPVREGAVNVLGSNVRYWDYGPEDSDVVIVAVHGFRGEHHGLEPVVAHLRGIRVISPDLPGFGASTAMTEVTHSIQGYSAWLRQFVELLGLNGRAIILGHSFGSIVTSAAVADGLATPQLILINPIAAPALSGPKGFLTWLTVQYYRAAAALPERAGYALLGNWLIVRFTSLAMVTSKDRRLRRWIHGQHHTYFSRFSDRDTVLASFDTSVTSDVSMAVDRISVPTLLIAADRDPITSVKALRRLDAAFADSHLVMLPNVGHLIHYERPREAAEAIVAFIGHGSVAAKASAS